MYIASVTAVANGVTYTSYDSLVIVHVVQSALEPNSANLASVAASVTANSTSASGASAVIQATQSITISGSYSAAPTNPAYSLTTPTIVAPGATISDNSTTSTSATATLTYANNGTYQAVFQGISESGTAKAYQNYTFTVVVAPTGAHYRVAPGASTPTSPHPGQFIVYEYAPGGAGGEDPAIDYESLGYEPLLNVYSQLISYNGSFSGPQYQDFIPNLATCVPGSPQCTKLYGNTLTNGVNFTFVINSAARFYDPATGVSWPVYPTDVVFSLARTAAFADLPCWSCNNGWILTQALLPLGNVGWDGGIHWKANNTPFWVFNQVRVNDTSAGCPQSALNNPADTGCVTLVANGLGKPDWPYFLELAASVFGGSVVPAGWFSASPQDAGIPGWTYNAPAYEGDHPIYLPGGYKSTNASFLAYVNSTMSPMSWDTWQKTGSAPPFWGNVQYPNPYTAGSGPYYVKAYSPGTSYLLQANPAYAANPFCTWAGCRPAPGAYVPSVSVTWATSQLPGELAYQAGEADFATIPTTDTALMLNLVQEGKIGVTTFPTIGVDFFPYNLNFNVPGAKQFDTSPITIPADFFSSTAVRQFFANAYPYATVQNTINTVDGVQYFFPEHGAIPQYMGDFYPANVTWPGGDPTDNPSQNGSAAWWWVQGRTPTSPYYDPELLKCTPSTPCEFPLVGQLGVPNIDEIYAAWVHEISTLTSGAIKPDVIDLSFNQEVVYSLFSGPYQNPMPLFTLAWGPDYPDPTDYVAPLYVQDGSYTASDTVKEQLIGNGESNSTYTNPYWSTSCPTTDNVSTPITASIANLIGWAHLVTKVPTAPAVPEDCQGAAYSEMQWALEVAAVETNLQERTLLYNLVEQIDSGLQLYTWLGQTSNVITYAPWINPSTFDPNVIFLGGQVIDSTWFNFGGNGVL
jgi:hypothetical protein